MKIAESWLREWVDPDLTTEELGHQLTMLGHEVDEIVREGEGIADVVVAEVFECGKHPDADECSVCKVTDGGAVLIDFVCGAPYGRVSALLAREYALQGPGWREAMNSALREVVLYVVRYQGALLEPGIAELRQRDLIRMQPVMDLAQRRLGEPSLRFADLAACVSVSEVCLRKLLARCLHMSPVAFLRLLLAGQLGHGG